MPPFSEVNWLLVVVGVVVSNGLGFLWYGPLFGAAWLRMIGKSMDEIESDASMFLVTALASLVSMIALALLVAGFGARGLFQGLIAGGVAAVGFSAPATLVYSEFEGPSRSVWFLYSAYQFVVYLIMGALFALF